MPLDKKQKQEIVKKIREYLKKQKVLIFVNISGIKAKELFSLRRNLKAGRSFLIVAKKTLLNLALKEENIPFKADEFKGELAMVFGFGDELFSAKIIEKFARENGKLEILGGLFKNEFMNKEKVVELAKIPSRENLLAKLVGTVKSPTTGFVNVLSGNIRNLICLLNSIKSNK